MTTAVARPASVPGFQVAPPAADALLAGDPSLPVVIGRADTGNGADDQLDLGAKVIATKVREGKRKPEARYVVYVNTTIDYGCRCPPFVLAPFWNSGRADGYLLPEYAPGVPEPLLVKPGLYRFAGRFDGRHMTGFDWLKRRGLPRKEGMTHHDLQTPVFVVDGWCFEPGEFEDAGHAEIYLEDMKQLASQGRFCPGATFPVVPPPEPDTSDD
jgi:hypothetical protein